MKVYAVAYKEKCIYTGQPIGATMSDSVVAKNVGHLLYLCQTRGWYVLSYQQVA